MLFENNYYLRQFDILGHFLLVDWAWLKLSHVTVTTGSLNSEDMISFIITTGSLNSQDMISQVNVYVMDIVLILCDVYLWRSIFKRGSYGFMKKFL